MKNKRSACWEDSQLSVSAAVELELVLMVITWCLQVSNAIKASSSNRRHRNILPYSIYTSNTVSSNIFHIVFEGLLNFAKFHFDVS